MDTPQFTPANLFQVCVNVDIETLDMPTDASWMAFNSMFANLQRVLRMYLKTAAAEGVKVTHIEFCPIGTLDECSAIKINLMGEK